MPLLTTRTRQNRKLHCRKQVAGIWWWECFRRCRGGSGVYYVHEIDYDPWFLVFFILSKVSRFKGRKIVYSAKWSCDREEHVFHSCWSCNRGILTCSKTFAHVGSMLMASSSLSSSSSLQSSLRRRRWTPRIKHQIVTSAHQTSLGVPYRHVPHSHIENKVPRRTRDASYVRRDVWQSCECMGTDVFERSDTRQRCGCDRSWRQMKNSLETAATFSSPIPIKSLCQRYIRVPYHFISRSYTDK